jgi:8-oxo-dGTP pyrophosphatase MutT (NUDIX family)
MKHNLETPTTDMVVGRGIIRNDDGQYLMGRRKSGLRHDAGLWEHLGGRFERGRGDRTLLDCTIREIREESGLEVVALAGFEEGVVIEHRELRPIGDTKPEGNYTAIGFLLQVVGGALHQPHDFPEHEPVRWVSREQALGELSLTQPAENSFYSSELMQAEMQTII